MFLWSTLKKNWRSLIKLLPHDGRDRVLEILKREYVEEMANTAQLLRHAERMRYPQLREKLLQIAAQEQKHALWLKERIIALGGEATRAPAEIKEGVNSWECLRMDLEEEKHCCADLTEKLAIVEPIDPETAELLRRILEEEKQHREEITDMLMRSDPQAAWAP